MTTYTPAQIATYASVVLGDDAAAVIAVAISMAECPTGDLDQLGDLNLQTAKWGPSIGWWQIRTLKADTGKGTIRDIDWLRGEPFRQAKAMRDISSGGTNWNAWTTYRNSTYRRHLAAATKAVEEGKPHQASLTDPGAWVAGAAGAAVGASGGLVDPAQAANAVTTSAEALTALGRFAALVASWATWQRILYLIAGAGLVAAGLLLLTRDLASSPAGQAVAGAALKAAL